MMTRIGLAAVMAAGLAASSAAAEDAAFEALLRTRPASLDDVCRSGIVRHRIVRWRQGDARVEGQAFAGVDEILQDVRPDAVRALERQGCAPHYLWRFLACTGVQGPPPSPRITPGEARVDTEEALAALMRRCMTEIEKAGITPSR